MLIEGFKNLDGFRLSSFYVKDRNGRLSAGPAWDYNIAFGNVNSVAGEAPVGWHYEQIQPGQPFFEYPWYSRLFEDPEFTLRHWDRYFELRQRKWNTASMFAEVEALAALLSAEAARREFDRWPRLGTCVWPNPDGSEAATTYESAVGWMKDWLRQRFIWMDSQFNPPPVYSEQGGIETFGGIVPLGFVMAMSHSNLPGGRHPLHARRERSAPTDSPWCCDYLIAAHVRTVGHHQGPCPKPGWRLECDALRRIHCRCGARRHHKSGG